MPSILISFHTPSNAGYAMAPLETMFFNVARALFGSQENVHFAFTRLDGEHPRSLPNDFDNIIEINRHDITAQQRETITQYIQNNNIEHAFCFDLQVRSEFGDLLRSAGIRNIVSYWGAPISSENSFIRLLFKRLEVALSKNKPNLFIFESSAMQRLAIYGRGIAEKNTCVIPTGVDTEKFRPNSSGKDYLLEQFNIPKSNKVAFYSGHMEERKGVKVIIESAIELIDNRGFKNWHFVLCGNRPGEEQKYLEMLQGKKAASHVIFAGYRTDLHKIMPGCDLGIVASTGWDSFPMSCLEMASCGLPLIVSALQGLNESIENGTTGYLFEPGNSEELASKIEQLEKDDLTHQRMSAAARERTLKGYSLTVQRNNLTNTLKSVFFESR